MTGFAWKFWQDMDAHDALARWDAGEIVWSIEMGGLGPGYEQCIQILIFELIRDQIRQPLPEQDDKEAWWHWGDATVSRINKQVGGFSGAQVGAAKTVAACILRQGYAKALGMVEEDRLIQVSSKWPRVTA